MSPDYRALGAITDTVFRFLRFCSLLDDSPVPADVAARMYEPRYLAFAPPGYDRGEDDQHVVVNVKTVRLSISRLLGCPVDGAHDHVRRRQNPNGALAETRKPRWIPVGD